MSPTEKEMVLKHSYTKCLDKGYLRLVDWLGSDLSVCRAARVSHNAEWRAGEDSGKDEKLINYLLKNKHTSPFEHVSFTFEVKCPIFVARQWQKHRTAKINEVSGRYTELAEDFYVPNTADIGLADVKNKQARNILDYNPNAANIKNTIDTISRNLGKIYKELLQQGCPREVARMVLPLNTYTKFFFTIDLHNLFHFIKLRSANNAQYEIRVYSDAMLNMITPIVPVCVKAFKENQ